MKKLLIITLLSVSVSIVGLSGSNVASAADSSAGNIIDDSIFDNKSSMTEAQIQNFINAFPSSCLLPQNYPSGLSSVTFKEPLDYFNYGNDTSPARIIWKTSQMYGLNPQVILATLEKEQNFVTGNAGCAVWRYNSALGYNCPDGSENALKDYPNIQIYDTCVARESNAGFSRQVNHATWQFKFDRERAYGNVYWGDDGDHATQYYGRMTQGDRKRRYDLPSYYYDGYTSIDGQAIYLSNGATAALYNFTPHFNNFGTIFSKWFGDAHKPNFNATYQSVENYTDATRSTTTPATPLVSGQKTYMILRFKNDGNVAWKNSGTGAVRLATLNTSNSPFCDSSWVSCGRPAEMKELVVNPGETATFEFWYKAPNVTSDTSYMTRFGLVSETVATMSGAQQVQTTMVQKARFTATYQSVENYTNSSKTTGIPATPLVGTEKTYMILRFKNDGNVMWRNSGPGAVRLATLNTSHNSLFCDSSWVSCRRPAEMKESVVNPGEIATFEFWYNAPNVTSNTSLVTTFGLVSEAVATMDGLRQVQTTQVHKPNFNATYQSVENYTDATRSTTTPATPLVSGQKTYMILRFKNDGNVAWKNSGTGAVRLATLNTSNSPFCDSSWVSCGRPAEMKELVVNPGETATFEFWYKAPNVTSDTSYMTRFGLVSETVATMSGAQQVQTTMVQKAN